MSDAPAPTRAEEGRELPSDADFLRETVKVVEWQRDNARRERNEERDRAAQAEAEVARLTQERDEALCLAEGPGTLLDLARGSVSRGMELHAAEAEVARLTAALKLCLTEMDWQIKSTNRCGDPNYECPLQDIHKPSDSHAEARHAARTALEAPHADK